MIKKFPIVIQGDWMQLIYHDGENRREALVTAATEWVSAANAKSVELNRMRLDPAGPTGDGTPNLELKVQQRSLIHNPALGGRQWSPDLGIPLQVISDWEAESIWTVPDEC